MQQEPTPSEGRQGLKSRPPLNSRLCCLGDLQNRSPANRVGGEKSMVIRHQSTAGMLTLLLRREAIASSSAAK